MCPTSTISSPVLRVLLKPHGVATFEFPHLLQLVRHNQFDTIYHEHFSYLSLTAVARIFDANGLAVFDVEEIADAWRQPACLRAAQGPRRAAEIAQPSSGCSHAEEAAGMRTIGLLRRLPGAGRKGEKRLRGISDRGHAATGKSVAAYGAAAKGNTLLNFAGVGPDLISFVADRNPAKQGKFMPGSRIPVVRGERPSPPRNRITSSSCHGTSPTRSWRSWTMPGLGEAACVTAISELEIR